MATGCKTRVPGYRRGRFPLLIPLLLIALPAAAAAQGTLSEITVIYGGSSSIQPPAGYTKIPVDLNQGAGGDYIYACYKKGVGAPITNLTVVDGEHSYPPAGWQRIEVDLNRNAGGDYIWLCYTKDPACSVVKDVIVLVNDQPTPPGYYKIPWDLNRNAGGAYIYLAFSSE